MADHHLRASSPPESAAEGAGDSFSDDTDPTVPTAGVDQPRAVDSDEKRVRTDVSERLDALLPGEAALVYQYLRSRLTTLFDDAGH